MSLPKYNPKFQEHFDIFKNTDYESVESAKARAGMTNTAKSLEEIKVAKEAAKPGGKNEEIADRILHTKY